MKHLKQIGLGFASVVLLGLMGVGVFYGAGQKQMNMSKMSMAKMDSSGTVFCPGMSTGQLCPMGTVATLKLSGVKKQRWSEALMRYNKAQGAATKQLLEEAKETLSPDQYAQVKTWFDTGLNPEINRLLAAKESPQSKKSN